MFVVVLLTQSSCDSFYSIFDVDYDNYALELGGDWPQHSVSRGIIPFREDFPTNNSRYAEVNEEWCVTYHYPVGKFVLEASTIGENELHFQIRLPDGTLALPSITQHYPALPPVTPVKVAPPPTTLNPSVPGSMTDYTRNMTEKKKASR